MNDDLVKALDNLFKGHLLVTFSLFEHNFTTTQGGGIGNFRSLVRNVLVLDHTKIGFAVITVQISLLSIYI